jgi:two-component system chemotaxis response regulator CheB
MAHFTTIVIGASMGGVEALQRLFGGLPADIPAALFVVQHIGRWSSQLPQILAPHSSLPVVQAVQRGVISPGTICIAPPDHHLILERGHTRLTRGPRENWARPAIDPLFRSAARVYGRRVVGVILTGLLNDGSAGLAAVRAAGGCAVVQDPADAIAPDMPWNALRHAGADYRVKLAEIPALLARLSDELVLETATTSSDWRWRAKS